MSTQAPLRAAAITTGRDQPGSRFRWQQHTAYLNRAGIATDEFHLARGSYPPVSTWARPRWLAASIGSAFDVARRTRGHDIRFLQREMVSTLCTAEPWLQRPFVLDMDDATFLQQRFGAVDRIARHARAIVCGNDFLASHFARFGKTHVLPTAVDTQRFAPGTAALAAAAPRRIGWSGSSSGFKYLYAIEPALKALLDRFADLTLNVIADKPPAFATLPAERVCFERWNAAIEVSALQRLSVGLMPLADSPWERGKCSFKLLTYMAVGIPVVASPVGMNNEVMAGAEAGFLARGHDEWVDTISHILQHPEQAARLGAAGRNVVVQRYSTDIISPRLASILRDEAGR